MGDLLMVLFVAFWGEGGVAVGPVVQREKPDKLVKP